MKMSLYKDLYDKYDGRYGDLVMALHDYLRHKKLIEDFRKWEFLE